MQTALLLAIAVLSQGRHPLTPDSCFSSIVITEGIRGGIIGPIVRKRVEVGFDWDTWGYRVTVCDYSMQTPEKARYLTAVVSRDWFEDVVSGMLSRGLEVLPPQPEGDGPDVYERDTSIVLFHGNLAWANRASGGCVSSRVDTHPSVEERRKFGDVLTFLHDAVAGLDLERGSRLDMGFTVQVQGGAQGRAFLSALEHALRGPHARAIDLRRVHFLVGREYDEVRFAWRGLQDLDYPSPRRRFYYGVRVAHYSLDTTEASVGGPHVPGDDLLERRRAFVADHPELPPRYRHLISEGWITLGMTPEMVTASWGKPRNPDGWNYDRHGRRFELSFDKQGRLSRGIPVTYAGPRSRVLAARGRR